MNTKSYKGASARTFNLLLNRAVELSAQGQLPTLNGLAEATATSRATVYRYFPSHADLVHTMMLHSLSNLMAWQPQSTSTERRVLEALDLLFEDFRQHETLFRSVLQLSLLPSADQALPVAGSQVHRGLRLEILSRALEPLRPQLQDQAYQDLLCGLSLLFGIEALVVLKDIWAMDLEGAKRSLAVTAQALIAQASPKAQP
jgi:AcrR family transcriptional regulator